jgi:hypothetical protein
VVLIEFPDEKQKPLRLYLEAPADSLKLSAAEDGSND